MHNIKSLQSLPYMELTSTLVPKHPAITRPLEELQLIYFQVGFHLNFNLFCILQIYCNSLPQEAYRVHDMWKSKEMDVYPDYR